MAASVSSSNQGRQIVMTFPKAMSDMGVVHLEEYARFEFYLRSPPAEVKVTCVTADTARYQWLKQQLGEKFSVELDPNIPDCHTFAYFRDGKKLVFEHIKAGNLYTSFLQLYERILGESKKKKPKNSMEASYVDLSKSKIDAK